MTASDRIPPKYDPVVVEQVILEQAAELHPQHLKADELVSRIVADSDDRREVEVATQAIRDLSHVGLFRYRDGDQIVAPTPAALRACSLLT